jgi:predicted NUDIX family NTP pyrophosphohydrolase
MIAHPGGPYFARRGDGWWSIVKGIVEPEESDLEAAEREFQEETGWPAPAQPWVELGETRLKSRKVVTAYGVEADLDPATLVPGLFTINGVSHPEIDRVLWADVEEARVKLNPALGVFLDRLIAHLAGVGNNVG